MIGGSEPPRPDDADSAAPWHDGTKFNNANGPPDPRNVPAPSSLALLTLALLRDFPQYYGYFQTRDFMFGKRKVGPGVKFVELYAPYADGLKTGFICNSGFNIVGSAVRDGRRLIAVAFGFRRSDLRDEFLVRLFDEAFAPGRRNRQKVWQIAMRWRPPSCSVRRVRHDPLRDAGRRGLVSAPTATGARRAMPDAGQADLVKSASPASARNGSRPSPSTRRRAGRHHCRPRARGSAISAPLQRT